MGEKSMGLKSSPSACQFDKPKDSIVTCIIQKVLGDSNVQNNNYFIATKWLILSVSAIAVLYFRRPDQLKHPYIWVEEGTISLPQYIAHGWVSIFYPVGGYLVLPSKIIFALSTKISFLYQPEISYGLTILFTILVLACIAFSPTYLKYPFLCALSVLFIPTDSEVFAVSEYAFWWGTLLAVIPLLWNDSLSQKRYTIARVSMVILGGLSSPLIVGFTVLYTLRLIRFRTRTDWIVLLTAISIAAIQLFSVYYTGDISRSPGAKFGIMETIMKFLGSFVISPQSIISYYVCAASGILLAILIASPWFYWRRKFNFGYLMLIGLLVLAIATSLMRISAFNIHPILAGQRYFFFPYIFLSWILLQIASIKVKGLSIVILIVFLFSVRQTVLYGQRFHAAINWQYHILSCAESNSYEIPVHTNGKPEDMWSVRLFGADCQRMIKDSLFGHLPNAIPLNQSNFEAYYNRGLAFEKMGQSDKAIKAYSTAIALNPASYEAYNNRGVLYGKAGMFTKAIEDLNQAIALNPKYATAYNNRGFTYTILNKFDQALKDYNKAIEFDQNHSMVDAYVDRGKIYLKRGSKKRAISDFMQACKLGNKEGCDALRAAQSQ